MHCMLVQVAIQKPGAGTRKQFKYDKVFGPDSNQEQVYEDTKALIRSVLDGTSALATYWTSKYPCCKHCPPGMPTCSCNVACGDEQAWSSTCKAAHWTVIVFMHSHCASKTTAIVLCLLETEQAHLLEGAAVYCVSMMC